MNSNLQVKKCRRQRKKSKQIFAFFDPKPDDFHGVKTLLQMYLDDKQWDLSSFVDLILAQTIVGTVIKLENDEDNGSFAILTALNLGSIKAVVKGKYLIEYKELRTDDDSEFLKEEVYDKHIKPTPPKTKVTNRFSLHSP